MNIADFANEQPPSTRIGPLGSYLTEASLSSPVDMYIRTVSDVIRHGTVDRLSETDFLGRLLVIGIISAAEAYIRAALSACVEICPVARASASKQSINLGGLLWHGQKGYSRSAFEHLSFTSKQEVSSAFTKFLGITLDDASFKVPLDEFETVCQLRHGIVHSDGLLPGKNAVLLDIPKYEAPVRITIHYEQLQNIAAVVNTLVFSLNRHLFDVFCRRWAIDWRQRADWDPRSEKGSFRSIWTIFHSVEEQRRRRRRSQGSRADCYSAVKANYNVL